MQLLWVVLSNTQPPSPHSSPLVLQDEPEDVLSSELLTEADLLHVQHLLSTEQGAAIKDGVPLALGRSPGSWRQDPGYQTVHASASQAK